jgi:sugar phosphate isomerase/epimerase
MKIATSTGDFSHYTPSIPEKVMLLGNTKFKYINLEQTGSIPAFTAENDEEYKKFASDCKKAAEDAGVSYVVSHAPCLHFAHPNALILHEDADYQRDIRAIRRSIEVCHILGIPRIVVHACVHDSFDEETFLRYNKMFYGDFLDLAKEYGITVMTENWDNDESHLSTGKQMRALIDAIGHPSLAACWDTAHGNIAHEARRIGQYENILALGDKLKGLHISDNFGDTHHHSWPFAGIINFDAVMQALKDVHYDGYFTFEASYTLLHHNNIPYHREPWTHGGEVVTKLLDPSIELKQKAVDLLFETGKHILSVYDCFEE